MAPNPSNKSLVYRPFHYCIFFVESLDFIYVVRRANEISYNKNLICYSVCTIYNLVAIYIHTYMRKDMYVPVHI